MTTGITRNGHQGLGCSYSWCHPSWRRGQHRRCSSRRLFTRFVGAIRLLCCARSRAHRVECRRSTEVGRWHHRDSGRELSGVAGRSTVGHTRHGIRCCRYGNAPRRDYSRTQAHRGTGTTAYRLKHRRTPEWRACVGSASQLAGSSSPNPTVDTGCYLSCTRIPLVSAALRTRFERR